MTDDTAFDRERIIKLQERAHKAHGDDASHRTAWLQYHSALQAAFERGTLVFANPDPTTQRILDLEPEVVRLRAALEPERLAFTMWKAEAMRAAPNVGRNRTPEQFADESPDTRERWLYLARAALDPARAALDPARAALDPAP